MADSRYTQSFADLYGGPASAMPPAPTPVPGPLSVGDMLLGRYRVMGSCGTGGFGTVLACWDTRLQRRVAIKRMLLVDAMGSPYSASTLAEGLAEARASSTLTHPNIVTVFDFEADDAFAYLVMEYVDGITLTELLGRVEGGTLTADEVTYLVGSVASALAFAHRGGVLHLDIKPSNIMIDRSGAIKLCDFGMATLASAAGYGDARGGTVGYMPPEQIVGDIVDERADVFALAVVTWQALSGDSPFAAPTAEESERLIERGPKARISKLVPETAGMAEEALLAALEPSVATRMSSVEEFASELTFCLGDAEEGQQSIRHLLAQTVEGDQDEPERVAEGLPISFRFPWIEDAIARGLSALCAATLIYTIIPAIVFGDGIRVGVAAAVAVLAALWTPAASLAVMGVLAAVLLVVARSATSILLSGALGLLVVVWWATVGLHDRHASPALLLPCALGAPVGAAAYAGFFLAPGSAVATATVGWMVAHLLRVSLEVGFHAHDVVDILISMILEPGNWISVAGCAAGALVASLIARARPQTSISVLGQVVGVILVVTFQLVAGRVENDGIWVAPTWDTVGIAVVLALLSCIVAALCGPRLDEREEGYV